MTAHAICFTSRDNIEDPTIFIARSWDDAVDMMMEQDPSSFEGDEGLEDELRNLNVGESHEAQYSNGEAYYSRHECVMPNT